MYISVFICENIYIYIYIYITIIYLYNNNNNFKSPKILLKNQETLYQTLKINRIIRRRHQHK